MSEGKANYEQALKYGKKCFRQSMSRGEYPYLPVLDEILTQTDYERGIDLGIIEIPSEFVIGTRTRGRTRSFARNFMPLVEEKSEFASKWISLCESHLQEGIRDPVLVWEYMNRFYVQEGNKRASVLKYFGAVTIPAHVTRILPKISDDPAVVKYFEYLDFCEVTGVHFIELSKPGAYRELLSLLHKTDSQKVSASANSQNSPFTEDRRNIQAKQIWSEDETKEFVSAYYKYVRVYRSLGGDRLRSTPADGLLSYIRVFGYDTLKEQTPAQIRRSIHRMWDEIALTQEEEPIEVRLDPEKKTSSADKKKLPLPHLIKKSPLKVAFLYNKSVDNSRWTASHDVGREHAEQVFGSRIEVKAYIRDENLSADEQLRRIIEAGARVVFVTESSLVDACLRTAVDHPEVDILNCSLNKPYKSIRTYYPRMYEAKFIAGAIAGALTDHDRIGFISKFPIYGAIAEINAFAKGVNLVNPRARIYLEWSSVGGITAAENRLREKGIHLISYRDFYDRKEDSGIVVGLINHQDGISTPLALPVWNWGVFYEHILSSVLQGSYRSENKKTSRSLNYYWGMSAGAVDLILSGRLPAGIRYLGESLIRDVRENRIDPFYPDRSPSPSLDEGNTADQAAIDYSIPSLRTISAEDIITMDVLEKNIRGAIPEYHELEPPARELVDEIGIEAARNPLI